MGEGIWAYWQTWAFAVGVLWLLHAIFKAVWDAWQGTHDLLRAILIRVESIEVYAQSTAPRRSSSDYLADRTKQSEPSDAPQSE